MKKIFFFLLISFFSSKPVVAEIIFKNCDLSPNYGKVTMQVYLEKDKINFEDSNGISKILDINEKNSTNISANDNSNDQIRELFIIDLKHGVIRVTLEASDSADQSTKDLLKNKQNIINTICEPKNLYSKKRPIAAVADNVEIRNIKNLKIRINKKINITLLHDPKKTLEKRIQKEKLRKK